MSHVALYDEVQDIIFMTASGSHTMTEEHELLHDMKMLIDEKTCKKVIVDHRESEINASTITYFDRHKDYENFDLPRDMLLAVVVKEIAENFQLCEDACFNRGRMVKMCTDIDQAVKWIKSMQR